ncbi:sodium:proton exchanger [Natronococcus pandeyae]|uniref:Sodium:proton exchanger n=1 Tax=Natronococcus pandeyae TaxID=2055836 RepID=A0A8J8Q8A0_9EURY|nr:sodium:proton exchanger [Natronococcus pandeyae]TYL38985.1 sodium:proton exchanger [Natronococcus pandeyae]
MLEGVSTGGLLTVAITVVVTVLLAVVGYRILRGGQEAPPESTEQSPDPSERGDGVAALPFFDRTEQDDARAIDPQVLVPLSDRQEHTLRLSAVACALKHRYGENPIRLFTVVDASDRGTTHDGDLAAVHDRITEYGDATNTAVQTEVSEDDDVAGSIVRTARASGDDLIVMSRNGPSDDAVHGTVVDEVVSQTSLPVYLFQLSQPLARASRLRLVIPRRADHHEGFYEAIYNVKQLADDLSVPITVYVFEQNVEHYRTLFDLVEIDILAEFRSVTSWNELQSTLATRSEPDDVLVTLAVREGEIGWSPELQTVTERFSDLPVRAFALFFLREDTPEYDDRFLRTG